MQNNGINMPTVPRVKHNAFSYVMKAILFLTLWFAMWQEGQLMFQMLPYTQEGAYLSAMMNAKTLGIFAKWLIPLFLALVYFGLYHLFVRYCYRNLTRTMSVLGAETNGIYIHLCASGTIAAGALVKGALNFLYAYQPLITNVARPLTAFATNLIVMGVFYLLVARKYERRCRPFVFSSMMLAMVVYLILL